MRLSFCRKSQVHRSVMQEPRRVPSSADDGIGLNLKFPGTCASEISLLSPQTCERSERAAAGCIPSDKCLHLEESVSRNSTRSEAHCMRLWERSGQQKLQIAHGQPGLQGQVDAVADDLA